MLLKSQMDKVTREEDGDRSRVTQAPGTRDQGPGSLSEVRGWADGCLAQCSDRPDQYSGCVKGTEGQSTETPVS